MTHPAFEAHITVSAAAGLDPRAFADTCERLGVKAVVIELPRGDTPHQPMTASYHRGSLADALAEARALAAKLTAAGHTVSRIKLEAVGANNDEVPETDEAARAAPADRYFEYHAKLLLARDADTTDIVGACERHTAHLSRNARNVRDDGIAERFVTMRVYGVGRPAAERRFDALVADLCALGLDLGQLIREYTVYDSNVDVDRGWLTTR